MPASALHTALEDCLRGQISSADVSPGNIGVSVASTGAAGLATQTRELVVEVEFAGDSGLQPAWDAVVAFRDSVEGDGDYLCLACFPEEPGGAGECPVVEVSPGVQLSVQEASAELPKGPRKAQPPGLGGDKAALPTAVLGAAAAAAAFLLVAVVAFVRRRAARRMRGAMASKLLSSRGHWSSGASGIEMQEWEKSALGMGADSFAAKKQHTARDAREGVAEGPPPVGHWEEHIDPDSGRPYYFNQATGEVQWAEGGVMMTGAEAETARRATVLSESNPLLENGEGGSASAGRAGQRASVEETLNPLAAGRADGWEQHVDPASGSAFFWNPQTGERTWEPPEPPFGLA